MKKIIKLTEKDLTKIINKVLLEQRLEQPLKIGDRGSEVTDLQQKLIDGGFLKLKNNKTTDYFGPLTQKALIRYQKSKNLKPTGEYDLATKNSLPVALYSDPLKLQNKTPLQYQNSKNRVKSQNLPDYNFELDNPNRERLNRPSDYLGKGGQFERELYGGSKEDYNKMKNFIGNFTPSKKSSLPLHIRALMDYLVGRTEPFTAADLTKEEQEFLKNVAITYEKTGFKYNTWKSIGAGNLPTAMTTSGSEKEKSKNLTGSLSNPGLAGEFMYTLGQVDPPAIKVSPDKKTVTVRDNYDFNSVNLPKEQILKNFTDALSSYYNGKGTFYSIVRNAVAFKEMSGYPGYPVNITV